MLLVPVAPPGPKQDEPGDHPGEERNAQVDEDALGDGADRDPGQVHVAEVITDQGRQHLDEDVGESRVEEHLEERVEGDQSRRVLGVAPGQVVPDDDHGNAAGQSDQDQADRILGLVSQEHERQPEHEDGTDHPVEQERDRQHPRVAEDLAQLLVPHLRQRRVHHQDQPEGDRNRRRANRQVRDRPHDARRDIAQGHTQSHRQEDPEGQVAVEEGKPPGQSAVLGRGRVCS